MLFRLYSLFLGRTHGVMPSTKKAARERAARHRNEAPLSLEERLRREKANVSKIQGELDAKCKELEKERGLRAEADKKLAAFFLNKKACNCGNMNSAMADENSSLCEKIIKLTDDVARRDALLKIEKAGRLKAVLAIERLCSVGVKQFDLMRDIMNDFHIGWKPLQDIGIGMDPLIPDPTGSFREELSAGLFVVDKLAARNNVSNVVYERRASAPESMEWMRKRAAETVIRHVVQRQEEGLPYVTEAESEKFGDFFRLVTGTSKKGKELVESFHKLMNEEALRKGIVEAIQDPEERPDEVLICRDKLGHPNKRRLEWLPTQEAEELKKNGELISKEVASVEEQEYSKYVDTTTVQERLFSKIGAGQDDADALANQLELSNYDAQLAAQGKDPEPLVDPRKLSGTKFTKDDMLKLPEKTNYMEVEVNSSDTYSSGSDSSDSDHDEPRRVVQNGEAKPELMPIPATPTAPKKPISKIQQPIVDDSTFLEEEKEEMARLGIPRSPKPVTEPATNTEKVDATEKNTAEPSPTAVAPTEKSTPPIQEDNSKMNEQTPTEDSRTVMSLGLTRSEAIGAEEMEKSARDKTLVVPKEPSVRTFNYQEGNSDERRDARKRRFNRGDAPNCSRRRDNREDSPRYSSPSRRSPHGGGKRSRDQRRTRSKEPRGHSRDRGGRRRDQHSPGPSRRREKDSHRSGKHRHYRN